MVDLSGIRNLADIDVPSPTIDAIYGHYVATRDDHERTYLGASTLGDDCDRALWYNFRWASLPEVLDGRKLRLFATGHREEARMIADLRAAGVKVEEVDPATGRQWAVEAIGGHFRGHLDGIATGVIEAPKIPHVFESKTHNEKSFKSLLRHGVKIAKPGHWRQMQSYMHLRGLTRALYMAHNKNTDELYIERVEYDLIGASQLMARAERIIGADQAPAKLFEDATSRAAFQCGWCQHKGVCHGGEFARVHCRSCLHSTPVEGGWHCARHDMMLDVETQHAGCANHLFLPSLVPGVQIDADEEAERVTYRMRDGSTWTDGAAA